jgi:hypothetical protein
MQQTVMFLEEHGHNVKKGELQETPQNKSQQWRHDVDGAERVHQIEHSLPPHKYLEHYIPTSTMGRVNYLQRKI